LVWSSTNTEGKIDGWYVERGSAKDFAPGVQFNLDDDGYIPYFETYFYNSEFTTWWGVDEKFGPILVSMVKVATPTMDVEGSLTPVENEDLETQLHSSAETALLTNSGGFGAGAILRRLGERATGSKQGGGPLALYRVLTQSKKGEKQIFIRSGEKSPEIIRALKVALGVQCHFGEDVCLNDVKFKRAKDIDLREDLLHLEKKWISTDYKFGILYAKKGDNENQMFSTQAHEVSPEFNKFLNLMGERVTLNGFKGYAGGLDTKADTTGLESIYTEFKNQRIMFHVSTLLPFYPRDEQQVERKRHLGNDIIVAVFAEPGAQFDPSLMRTHFNHVYCVVSVDKEASPPAVSFENENKQEDQPETSCRVRIEVAVKHGVRPFAPPLPNPTQTHFNLDNNLREFLLSKLVNGERTALKSPAFATKLEKTRKVFIEQLIDTKLKK